MRTLMVFVCVSLLLGVPATVARACDVELVDVDAATWYLYSDDCVGAAELVWEPEVRPDKRRPRDEPVQVAPIQACRTIPVVWRLESGDIDAFNWQAVRDVLAAQHGVTIGETRVCTVCGIVAPTECFRTLVEVFPAYERRVYRVSAGGEVAMVSVLAPRDGMALVYNDALALDYHVCIGAVTPLSALGTCGSSSALPETGYSCRDAAPGSGKLRPRDDPVFGQPHADFTTWGAVKAVYTDE